ncbi:MAG: hypothetical protein ACRDHW_00520 [Ktedonobacteraceae bacterium]
MKQEQNNPFEQQRRMHCGESRLAQAQSPNPAARQAFRCANCEIEFFWSPTVVQGRIYCCTGCAAGGPCNCDYSLYRSVTIFGVIHYDL